MSHAHDLDLQAPVRSAFTTPARLALCTPALLLATFVGALHAQGTNELGWTTERENIWEALRASNTGGWWTELQTHAINDKMGLRHAMLYRITGDPAHADAAWEELDHFCGESYRPGDCGVNYEGACTGNCLRDRFTRVALVYSLVADALPPQDKADFKDVLTLWYKQSFCEADPSIPSQGIRVTDTDELIGGYFGLVLFALAIQAEDPVLSAQILNHGPVTGGGVCESTLATGGVDATASNTSSTMRNAIRRFLEKADGEWIESSQYNNLTVGAYLAIGIEAINAFYGEDKFPEFDAQQYMDTALALLTPDVLAKCQWGDQQDDVRGLHLYSYIGFVGALSYLSKDPNGLDLFADLFDRNGSSGLPDVYHWWVDPFSSRAPPQGQSAFTLGSGDIGWATHRSGWGAAESLFCSQMSRFTNVDHDAKLLSNFNLYRNGAWAVSNPRGYYSGNNEEEGYANNVWLGGIGAKMKEAHGQSAFQSGPGYLYHSGLTAGNQKSNRTDAPPREWVHEYNRSLVYFRNEDGSDTIVLFERVNSCDWLHSVACQDPWRIAQLDHLTELRGCGQVYSGGCHPQADGKHKWILHSHEPVEVDAFDPDLRHWTVDGSGEEVYWQTFVDGYTFRSVNALAAYNAGFPDFLGGHMTPAELAAHERNVLIPDQLDGFQVWLNALHVGGPFAFTELASTSGDEVARGLRIETAADDKVVLFNATENEPPPPSTVHGVDCNNGPDGFCVNHDPERFEKTLALRRFKRGFDVEVPTDGDTRVYVFDLDPERAWTARVDGSPVAEFSVSDQGVAIFDVDMPGGSHALAVESTSECSVDDWRGCDTQQDCQNAGWYWYGGRCHEEPPPSGDPWTVVLVPSQDVKIKGSSPSTNHDGSGLELKRITDAFDEVSLLDFDMAAAGFTGRDRIESVVFRATSCGQVVWNETNYLYARKAPFVESEATWQRASTGVPWHVVGCRGSQDMVGTFGTLNGALASITQQTGGAGSVQTYQNIGSAMIDYVQANVDGTLSFVLHQKNIDNSDVCYYDKESAVGTPCQLEITFSRRPGQPGRAPRLRRPAGGTWGMGRGEQERPYGLFLMPVRPGATASGEQGALADAAGIVRPLDGLAVGHGRPPIQAPLFVRWSPARNAAAIPSDAVLIGRRFAARSLLIDRAGVRLADEAEVRIGVR